MPDKTLGEDELDEPPEVTVIIKAVQGDDPDNAGQISAISVQLKEGTTPIDVPEGGTMKDPAGRSPGAPQAGAGNRRQ